MKLKYSYLSLLLAFNSGAFAEEAGIETIVVTSDFRELSVDKLPSSATILAENELVARQAQHLEDVFNKAANVNFNAGASRGRFVQIRGIGERSQFAEPINPSVGFMVDNMDFSGTMAVGTLFDVEQVEVLKGPQGTAFGSSAMAGMIKIKTKEADGQAGGKAQVSVAQKNSYNLALAYGDAINSQWNYRVALQQYKSDGYVNNIHLVRSDTNNLDEFTSRLKLRYMPSDQVTLDFSVHHIDVDNGYDAFSLDNNRSTRSDEPGFDTQETTAFGAELNWEFDSFDFNGRVNTSTSDISYGYDEDWTFPGFHPDGYASTDHYLRDRDTDSLDLRLSSSEALNLFGLASEWVLGAYVKNTDESATRDWTYGGGLFTSDYSADVSALYGELYPRLSDSLTLTLGLRVEDSSLDYADSTGFAESTQDTLVGGRIVLDFQADKDTVLYASVNRGYKLGGVNPDDRVAPQNRVFDPEYNWNYELGIKRYLADGDLYVALSAFRMEREDAHVSDFVVETIDGTPGSSFVDATVNADVGTNTGFELESRYQVSEDALIFLNLGVLDAKVEERVNAKGEVVPGRDQAQAPNYTLNLGTEIGFGEDWLLTVEADAKDRYYFSDGHDERSVQYFIFHANLTHTWNGWSVSLWGKNLFNKEYYTRGFGGFPNDPRDGYSTLGPYYQLANGRKMGMTVEYQF